MTGFLDAIGIIGLMVGVAVWMTLYQSGMAGMSEAGPYESRYSDKAADDNE